MEAADTICYRIIDIEDSVKLRLLDAPTGISALEAICNRTPRKEDEYKPQLKAELAPTEYLSYLRAKAISSLIYQAFDIWVENYDDIMSGNFNTELLDISESKNELKHIKTLLTDNAFNHALVLKIELAGYEVLGGLLGEFCGAAFDSFDQSKNKKLSALVPPQFLSAGRTWNTHTAERLLEVSDFVSRMTDSYAIDLYRSLKGINLTFIE